MAASFSLTGSVLTITTALMVLKLENGAVVYIKDVATDEEILNTTYAGGSPPANTWGFVGFASKDISDNIHERQCIYNASPPPATPTLTNDTWTATLTYSPCYRAGSPVAGTSLVFNISVDSVTEEISISATATESEAGYTPYTVDIPIMHYTGPGVIMGPQRVARADADITRTYVGSGTGQTLSSPTACVLEGTNACVGAWSENTQFVADWMDESHIQNDYDHIAMHVGKDPKLATTPLVMSTGPWRFTTQTSWVGVASRWRARMKVIFTDAKFLWENASSWVRNIHCRYGRDNRDDVSHWDEVALVTPVANTLVDLGGVTFNGFAFEILWGQITPRLTNASPTDAELAKIALYGWKAVVYYWYNAWNQDPSVRLASVAANIPGGWTAPDVDYDPANSWNPDYAGTPTGWPAYWNGISFDYGSLGVYLIHPAAANFKAYIQQNYPNFCDLWGVAGAFWDVSGADKTTMLVDGDDYMTGQRDCMKLVYADYPIVAEYYHTALLPYAFYTYEGAYTWDFWGGTVNHPFRTALLGSFLWQYDSDPPIVGSISDIRYLMGGLPGWVLDNDYQADWTAPFWRVRAQMFCTYEMYNDLPDDWDYDLISLPTNMAYYRTNSTAMFKLVKRATGRYAYVNADNDAYILQHELKTGESAGHKTFADTYTSIPTVKVSSGLAENVTLTGFDYAVSGTGSWLVFGTQPAPTYSRGDYFTLPGDAADLEIPYTAEDVADVAAVDGDRVAQSAPSQYAIHEFKNDASGKSTCTVTWWGQTTLGNTELFPTILEIYNTNTLAWEELTRDTSALADTNFELTFPILSGLDNYKDTNGFITCRVYQSSISR